MSVGLVRARIAISVVALAAPLLGALPAGAASGSIPSPGPRATATPRPASTSSAVTTAETSYLALAPSTAMAAETVKATGKLPDAVARPVSVQRKKGADWVTVAETTSSSTGSYATTFRARSVGGYAMRVKAPSVTIKGRLHPTVKGSPITLDVVAQSGSVALPDSLVEGQSGTATVAFSPVRPGRKVSLQVDRSGTWESVAVGTQSSSGNATFPLSAGAPGSYSYRARAAAASGAATYFSPARTLKVTSTPPPPPTTLAAGQTLTKGQLLRSPNKQYEAYMQDDGNFVVYQVGVKALWASNTGTPGSSIVMQTDGNLVVYQPDGRPVWSSNTAPSSNDRLALQDDGNLVLYSRGGVPLWASRGGRNAFAEDTLPTSGTLSAGQALWSHGGQYQAIVQDDGNFVVYKPGTGALWDTRTGNGTAGSSLVMQSDGNLVLYQPGRGAVWSSDTNPSSNGRLVMQDDGNLVIYASAGAVWASRDGKITSGPSQYGTWPGTSGPKAASQYYGYPYPNASQCTAGGSCVPDSWRFYQGQCTSWVAYRLSQMNGFSFDNYYGGKGLWGDASQWADRAGTLGIAVNGTPKVGSVAWYSGHVAYVEKVNSATSVDISEMNYDYGNGFRIRTITTSSGWPRGFIHIHDR